MARKRTKGEALERLIEARGQTGKVPLKGRARAVHDLAYLGAAGLIMLDPMNRLADERIVLPLDMVCIPAYQAYMIEGTPSLQIYVRAGETIIPTGGNVKDVAEALEEADTDAVHMGGIGTPKQKRGATAYQRAYKKAFKQLSPDYKTKKGVWKKDGFKRCVKAAHKKARGGK